KQEIRNALYHGPWLTSAKTDFSPRNCAAYRHYGKYMAGQYIRQKYLETAFSWKAAAEGFTGKDAIAAFMQAHRADKNADDLWFYFENVFKWVQANFGHDLDKSMKGVAWGLLYNEHKDDNLDPKYLQKRVKELLANDEVTAKSGIYAYLLERETPAAEKHLHPRQFSASDAQTLYNRQNGRCALCGKPFELKDMHADHIKPWSKGGRTALENGQMLCATCNLKKGSHTV
ncbi:MAG: HNH endonuclease, partial [Synergistaceae bacterium]|nr:HNH endonuclease [Synergistaceae bacterium]